MRLRLIHETHYAYAAAVEQAHHLARMRPAPIRGQILHEHRLQIRPEPTCLREHFDVYGQSLTYFEISQPHAELRVLSEASISTRSEGPSGQLASLQLPPGPPWGEVARSLAYQAGQRFEPAQEFVLPSTLAPVAPSFRDYLAESLDPALSVHQLACRLASRIHREFRYAPTVTDVHTPPQEALRQRAGVCQDFAQVMIACLRSLGLAAKYVSGYLLTEPPPGQPRLLGADATHAWAAVFCPQHGWLEIDPTNDCLAAESHIVLAYGRDYTDVVPLRGVIRGGGASTLKVAVTVMPESSGS